MDRRMSQSLPMLFTPMCYTPLCYRDTSPMWAAHHSRHRRRKHYYVGGVRTQLIGADSYPNPSRSPRRVVLCGPSGSYQRMTRSSSTAELSRTAVYCSREDLRNRKSPPPRAVSCEDVFRGTSTTGLDSSRFSESGVSLNDSRTDAGSCAALEDVDGVSQYSFGSSSAFHEITCDSEMDRPDSDCLSVPGSGYGYSHDRFRDSSGHDSESRGRRRDRGGHPRKIRHDSGSREKFLAELTAASSGRSSPRGEEEKEFFHSTPTKRGSPILSIFPADDEDDIHFPSHLPKDLLHDSLNQSSVDSLLCPTNDSFPDSLPTSPCEHRDKRKEEEEEESREDIRSSMEAVKEALNRRRRQFYASFHHDQQQQEQPSPGDSVQTWVSTGHPQHHTLSTSPFPLPDTPSHHDTHQQQQEQQQQQQEHQQQSHQGQPQLSPSSAGKVEGRSVRDRVRAIEQGQDFQTCGADQPPTPSPLTAASLRSSEEEEDGRRGVTTITTTTTAAVFTPLAASEGGGGAGKVSSSSSSSPPHQQLHSPLSSSSPGTQLTTTPPLLNNEPDSPYSSSRRRDGSGKQGKDVNSADDAERQKVSSSSSAGDPWNELSFCEDDHSTSLSSPSFRDNRGEINQGERGVSSGSGVEGSGFLSTTNLSEADGTCLQLITTGADDQGSEANYLAVSGDDRYANTGAKLVTANTTTAPPLQSADAGPTAVTSGSGIPDVYQRENRLCGIKDGETNLTAEGATSVETGVTTSVAWGKDSEEKEACDSETNWDPRYDVQEREFERLVAGFSDIDNLNEDDSVDNESGSEKNKQDPSLYHARPIQITSPDSGDNSPLVAVHSRDSTPSLLLQDSDVTREDDADDTAPDREDAEVQSLLQGSVDTLSEAASSCDWQQGQKTATDMEYYIHLLPSSTDPALDQSAAALGVMTVREVSQHHTRHVHHKHTTVQETVTTRRTTVHQQGEGSSPTSMLKGGGGSHAEGFPASENRDFELTDTTVSRITVTERNNEVEESTTRKTTRIPQSQQEMMGTNGPRDSFTTLSHTDAGSGTMSKTAHKTQQQGGGYTDHAEAMLKQADVNDSRHVLDDLQEQLSVLSSEHPSLDSAVSSVHRLSPPFGYKDHAEASLPQTESNSVLNTNSVVRGTGSVSITLDRPGYQQVPEDPTSDTKQTSGTDGTTDQVSGTGSKLDAPLYHARAVQILPAGDETPGRSTESRQELAASSRHGDSSWGLTGSSSEINDSDDRCTPASAADSHRTLLYSDSDSCVEGKSAAHHALQDFLATMQGQQLTSDQPSLHRSVDVMEEDFPPHLLLHPHFLQETILEADDEAGSTEEDAPLNPDIDSYKSSLHFCVPESTPSKVSLTPSVLHAQHHQNAAASESRADELSAQRSLHDLSERFNSVRDISHQRGNKTLTHPDSDLLVSQHDQFANLLSSEVNKDGSAYNNSASGEVQQKTSSETSARHRLLQPTPSQGLTNRRLSSSSSHRGPKKAQWVQDKVHLFQKLLNDFEWQSKTSEQKLMDEMVTTDTDRNTRRRKGDDSALEKQQSGFCDDLYRLFTREHLELRQNHVCPVVEDHMPAFRFKRFLRKKHNSKLKGHAHGTVRIRHQLEGLEETSLSPRTEGEKLTPSDAALAKTRHPPYHLHPAHRILSPGKQQQQLLRGRYISDVFTDDADVNRSMSSDSAYSSLSGTLSSRHVSDLDSTFRSVTGSSADVSINSSVADVSLAEDKLRSLSDVFDHPEMFEGDVDEARLDRLMVGHHKAETL